ncbi:hypothetical protein T01_13639 [Trichinella spiralis]|uniref:Uncharacterized protein n=1 Tax=Trichinella spiralis TaxID=6334 RepID=A0A0V0ZB38_TRISP|nr:hypothetical protein T01_13639 [Trichinella spiralis]
MNSSVVLSVSVVEEIYVRDLNRLPERSLINSSSFHTFSTREIQ